MGRLISLFLPILCVCGIISHATAFPGARVAQQGGSAAAPVSVPLEMVGTPASTFRNTASTSALTLNYTVPSGCTDCLLYVGACAHRSSSPVALMTATYDGVSMTSGGSETTDQRTSANWFYMVNPPDGASLVVSVTPNASARLNFGVVAFQGVHQTVPVGTAATANGSGLGPSVAVPSALGELVVDVVCWQNTTAATETIAPHASQTQIFNQLTDTNLLGNAAGSYEAGGVSVTMSWAISAGGPRMWAIVGVPLKPF